MKKILLIILCIPLIFNSCKKEEDNQPSPLGNPGSTNPGIVGYTSDNGRIYKTTDSGVTWTEKSYPGYVDLMSFVN